jgi:tryptophan-rich sensory protein
MRLAHARSDASLTVPSWLGLAGFVVLCQLAGLTGAAVTDPAFYAELARPAWAPPGWLFGPVWVTLYAAMGVAAWLVWRSARTPTRAAALRLFAAQLAINAIWTPVFFGMRSIAGGLAVIVALGIAIVATIALFARVSRPAAWLLVPYAAWVTFATALNASIWMLN